MESGHSTEQRDAISITSHLMGGGSGGGGKGGVGGVGSQGDSERDKKLKNLKKVIKDKFISILSSQLCTVFKVCVRCRGVTIFNQESLYILSKRTVCV